MEFNKEWKDNIRKILSQASSSDVANYVEHVIEQLRYIVESLPPNEIDHEKIYIAIKQLCEKIKVLPLIPSLIDTLNFFCDSMQYTAQQTAIVHLFAMTHADVSPSQSPPNVEAAVQRAASEKTPLVGGNIVTGLGRRNEILRQQFGMLLIRIGHSQQSAENYMKAVKLEFRPAFHQASGAGRPSAKQAFTIFSNSALMAAELSALLMAIITLPRANSIFMATCGTLGVLYYFKTTFFDSKNEDAKNLGETFLPTMIDVVFHHVFEVLEKFKQSSIYYSGLMESVGRLIIALADYDFIHTLNEELDEIQENIDKPENANIMIPFIIGVMVVTMAHLSRKAYLQNQQPSPAAVQKEIDEMGVTILERLSKLPAESQVAFTRAMFNVSSATEMYEQMEFCWRSVIEKDLEQMRLQPDKVPSMSALMRRTADIGISTDQHEIHSITRTPEENEFMGALATAVHKLANETVEQDLRLQGGIEAWLQENSCPPQRSPSPLKK